MVLSRGGDFETDEIWVFGELVMHSSTDLDESRDAVWNEG